MATSRGFGQFSRRMTIVADSVEKQVEKVVRRAALVADQVAVLATPVDTGRARANWIASIGEPDTGVLSPDPSGQAAIAQAVGALARYRLGPSIFLTNNVEYIVPLENGHSRQAPSGMTAAAIQSAAQVVRGAKIVRT